MRLREAGKTSPGSMTSQSRVRPSAPASFSIALNVARSVSKESDSAC